MAGGNKKGSASIPKVKTGPSMKFKPPIESGRAALKGTKPLAEAASVQHILMMMIVHLSRKILYGIEISHRVGMYIIGTLILGVISDIGTNESKSYLARKDNIFNVYFVKYCWVWTMLFLSAFVFVSSYTTSCGRKLAIKSNLMRLVIATSVWYGFSGLFLIIDEISGVCNITKFLNKHECMAGGYQWKGLDISGHCFVLVWCNLIIVEEAKCYLGWERIKDILRTEEHKRLSVVIPDSNEKSNDESTVLSRLSPDEFVHLRAQYRANTIPIRVLFCFLSLLLLLWDIMIVCTVMYFHMVIEKVIASCLAVIAWFILYRGLYVHSWSPGLPGEGGPFKYVTFKNKTCSHPRKRDSFRNQESKNEKWGKRDDVPTFMGMPLYALNQKNKVVSSEPKDDENIDQGGHSNSNHRKPSRTRSRSSSRIRLFDASKSSLNLGYL